MVNGTIEWITQSNAYNWPIPQESRINLAPIRMEVNIACSSTWDADFHHKLNKASMKVQGYISRR